MRHAPRRKPDPFDNPLISMLVHLAATLSVLVGASWAAEDDSIVPLVVAAVFVVLLEIAWWHKFFIRR